jgi:hypothetical protein
VNNPAAALARNRRVLQRARSPVVCTRGRGHRGRPWHERPGESRKTGHYAQCL